MTSHHPAQQTGYDFRAAALEVYDDLGHGFTEEIYQESLEIELSARNIPFQSQPELTLYYQGRPLRRTLRPDLIVVGEVLVELKAVEAIAPEHEAQLLNYLKAARLPVGYLINFGCTNRLEWKRFVRTKSSHV